MTIEKLFKYKQLVHIEYAGLSDKIKREINEIINFYDDKFIILRLLNIKTFIEYDVEDDWINRLHIIKYKLKNLSKNDLYSCEIRYGKEKGKVIFEESKKLYSVTKDKFISKYGEEEGIVKWNRHEEMIKSDRYSLNYNILKYGEEEGTLRWNNTLFKKFETEKKNFLNKKRRNGLTLIEFQKKYGDKIGYDKWYNRCVKNGLSNKIEYFIAKYGEDEGKIKWEKSYGNMDKTSFKSFIERYGNENGVIEYEKFIEKLKYSNTIEYYIEKYGEEEGKLKRSIYLDKIRFKDVRYSKISQDLFWNIFNLLNNDEKNECYFAELNKEYFIRLDKDNFSLVFLDFKLRKKIIEFDGEYWHKNTKEKDELRDYYLNEKGYEIFRVKEIDYYKNKSIIIDECLKFLKNE